MKKFLPVIVVIGVILLIGIIIFFAIMGVRNQAIQKEEMVNQAWAQVQNQYQRRLDLIPNLVESVKGYAAHEKGTLEGVIEMRNQATKINISKEVLDDPATFKKFQQVQGELSGFLTKLMAITEAYPQLKANENFLALQSQLEGTENRIAVERKRFNEIVTDYNIFVRQFPNSIFVGAEFKVKQTFQADEGAENAPKVKF